MTVFFVFFLALAISRLCDKKIYETVALTIVGESLFLYVTDTILGTLTVGFNILLVTNSLGVIYCIFSAIKDFSGLKKYLLTPESFAWLLLVAFFALSNVGRSLIDHDDYIMWGLQVKSMYLNNHILPLVDSKLQYPSNTSCWLYLACKTWPFGYTDSVILWAYDTYIMACLLPLFRHVNKGKTIIKFISLIGICLLVPISLTNSTYINVYTMLCADVLIGALVYYASYLVSKYSTNQNNFYFVQLVFVLSALTLTKRIGIAWTVFPLVLLAYFALRQKKLIALGMAILTPGVALCFLNGPSINMFIPLSAIFPAVVVIRWSSIANILRRCPVASVIVVSIAMACCVKLFDKMFMISEDSQVITRLFFNGVFSGRDIGFGTLIHIPLFGILLLAFCVEFFLGRVFDFKSEAGHKFSKETLELILIESAIFINLAILYVAYIRYIGIQYELFYEVKLPAFDRYITPYYMIILLWFLEQVLSNTIDMKPLLIYSVIFVLMFADIGNFTDYIFGKTKLEFPGLDNSNVQLTADDKIYYVNHIENQWYNTPFYYYVYPAKSSIESAIGYNEDTGTVDATVDEFERYLIDEEFDYLYIKVLYDQFIDNYSSLFVNPEIIHDNSFYRVNIVDGKVQLTQL